MVRWFLSVTVLALATAFAGAHMVYVVPSADGKSVTVVFSDTLAPDEKVKMEKVAGLKLFAADGSPVAYQAEDHKFTAALAGPRVVFGRADYGLMSKAEKPTLLVYHPKAVPAGVTGDRATVGEKAELEVVPVTDGGKTKFRLLAKGKPVADAEGTVVLPDGAKEKVKTDATGHTIAFVPTGRYAAYLKLTEAKAGEHAGKKYEEVRHYATLVVDVK